MTNRTVACLGLLLALSVGPSGCGGRSGEVADAVTQKTESQAWIGAFDKTILLYGGIYKDPKLNGWLSSVGRGLAAHCGRPDITFTFTILDSGEINAFSTPGGFVYVTRGLVALADNEAEVAAALSHEMAHLIRGDQAERYRQSQETGLADLFSRSPGAGHANVVLMSERARFSQDQEFRADADGIGIMMASGYDPRAMASLLTALGRQAESAANSVPYARPLANASYVDSHPLTTERVAAAARIASLNHSGTDRSGRQPYLRAVDGLVYGPGAGQGYVRDQIFVHPGAGITFRLPPGFVARTAALAFVATRTDGAALVLTSAAPGLAATPFNYLTEIWARNIALDSSDPIIVNGRPAAMASAHMQSDLGPVDVRLVTVGWSPSLVYRLVFIAPAGVGGDLQNWVLASAGSFRALSPTMIARVRPLRLKVVTTGPRDTLGSLLRRMASDVPREELFRTLNRLASTDSIRPGWQYKLVE